MASFAPTADLRSGRGRTASFAPTAGTQCLSRLRRAHSAFRAYGGHTVPFRAYGGHTVPFRAYGGHTVPFRAYGGHTVPFAPTAGTQCLSRLRRSLQKETARNLLATPYGEGSTEASQSLYKSEKGRNPTFPHDIRKTAAKNTEGPSPRKSPGAGSLLFIREKPSPLFSISQWLPCSASRDVQRLSRTRGVFRAYGGNHGGKPQLWRVPLRKGNPTEAISQSSRHNA